MVVIFTTAELKLSFQDAKGPHLMSCWIPGHEILWTWHLAIRGEPLLAGSFVHSIYVMTISLHTPHSLIIQSSYHQK
ncbi:hypothetical protein K7X08_036138 [Anisodus acutangulus]|uniref:Uncharacterized protein n=1 Tax=Anisodus acutangulus TaxID=402998 RepID=A0A9Q1QWK8_9SOLA|nr:hypothetical protein K7X08_036138 [Anisodus acutangulus]